MEFDATFIVSAISFIIFVLIMNKILYQPILNIIEKRRAFFKDNEEETLKNNEEKDILNQKYDEKMSDAHKNSREITSLGFERAKNKKDEIIKDAKEKANSEVQKKLKTVEDEKLKAKDELNNKSDELSDLITSKLLGEGG